MLRLLLTLALTLSVPANAAEVERIAEDAAGSTLVVRLGPDKNLSIPTPLFEMKVVSELAASEDGAPLHFLVSARPCKSCPEEESLFLIRSDGKKPMHFVPPGRILDPKTRAVLLQSRAFYGKCLNETKGVAYVVFQSERVDRRRTLQSSVYIAEPAKEFVREQLIERRAPRVETALKRVRAKDCVEISGKNRLMLAKPLDLTPRRGLMVGEDDADGEEEAPKENQTQKDLPSPDAT